LYHACFLELINQLLSDMYRTDNIFMESDIPRVHLSIIGLSTVKTQMHLQSFKAWIISSTPLCLRSLSCVNVWLAIDSDRITVM